MDNIKNKINHILSENEKSAPNPNKQATWLFHFAVDDNPRGSRKWVGRWEDCVEKARKYAVDNEVKLVNWEQTFN